MSYAGVMSTHSSGGRYSLLYSDTDTLQAKHTRWCPKLTRVRVFILVCFLVGVICLVYLSPSPVQPVQVKPVVLRVGNRENVTVYRQHGQDGSGQDGYDFDRNRVPVHVKHTGRSLPHCIIIGVRKAGTRALLTFLDLHPQIRIAKSEIHFFDEDENYELGLEWYRKKMPFSYPDQITMEKTPAYFSLDYVPERVHRMNSSIKLIMVLRDPIDRAMSDYLQIHENKVRKDKPDLSFVEHCIDENGMVDHSYNPLKRSIYFRQMQPWLDWFPRNQFLLLSGENLIENPLSELRRVESFLNIGHRINADNFYYNETRGFYCMRNETGERCLAESKGRQHPEIDPLVLQKLRGFFRPFNMKFYSMVGEDFGWT